MTPTTTVTTTTRRRRRPTGAGVYVHDAHPTSPRRGATVGTLFDHAPDTTAASHRHFYSPFSGSARYSRPSFSIESGWVDGFQEGKSLSPVIAQRGKIEEVDDLEYARARDDERHEFDERNDYAHINDLYDDNDEEDDLRYYEKANNKVHVKRPSVSTVNGTTSGVRRNTFGIPINGAEPGQTFAPPTPPSPPRPLPNGHARLSPPHTVSNSLDAPNHRNMAKARPVASSSKPKPTPPRTKPPPPPLPRIQTQIPIQTQTQTAQVQPVLDTTAEIALLEENFNLLRTVQEDLQIMCTVCRFCYLERPCNVF